MAKSYTPIGRTAVNELVKGATGPDYMKFVDYEESYKDHNKEFLRGDTWELHFQAPKVVYYPGDDIFNARLNQVQVGIDQSVSGFEKRMRGGFTIFQKTGQNTSGSLSLSFVDREDQAITYFVDDWREKIADRDTKYSFRKDDVVAEVVRLTLLNSSRIPVRTLEFLNCIISDHSIEESGMGDDGTDRADVQLNMNFEHYKRQFENI